MRADIIILDFDGVIVESVGIKTTAFRALFSGYPGYVDEIVRYHLLNDGLSRYRKFDYIYREILKRPLSEDESERLGRHFSELVVDEIKKCPFVAGAVDFLEKRHGLGVPMYVASGTPEAELREIVKGRGLRNYFRGVYGTPATKSVIIRRTLAESGAAAGDAVFVGDTLTDYEAACDTGVRFVGRVNGVAADNPLVKLDIPLVNDLRELGLILDGATRETA